MLSMRAQALRWLALREHSRTELRRKLLRAAQAKKNPKTDTNADTDEIVGAVEGALQEVDYLLDELVASGYLSEERFVEARIHQRSRKWGLQRIQHEMRQHHLAIPEDALLALQQTELERIQGIWQRKFGKIPATSTERAKQIRFLQARGFSIEIIRALYKRMEAPSLEEISEL